MSQMSAPELAEAPSPAYANGSTDPSPRATPGVRASHGGGHASREETAADATSVREMPGPLLWMHEAVWLGIAALAEEQFAYFAEAAHDYLEAGQRLAEERDPSRQIEVGLELARLRLERVHALTARMTERLGTAVDARAVLAAECRASLTSAGRTP